MLVGYGFDDENHVVQMSVYLECLKQALVLTGLEERAKTIAKFAQDRSYAEQLAETDVVLCKCRFLKLAAILKDMGWKENAERPQNKHLYFEGSTHRLYYENISEDMMVFLRSSEHQLESSQRRPSDSDTRIYTEGLESLISGVKRLLDDERRTG